MEKSSKPALDHGWSFAVVNGRLAEIHFDKKYGIWAHSYVERKEYNKSEQRMIAADIKKCRFTYRKGYYIDRNTGKKQKRPSIHKIFSDLRKSKKKLRRLL